MNILKNIQHLYSADKIQENEMTRESYAGYYDRFLEELELLVGNADLESVYKQLNYIRIELVCLKEFLTDRDDFRLFYLTKSIYILETHIQIITWKISDNLPGIRNNFVDDHVKWTGTVTEFVELGYALIESKRISHGKVKIKYFISRLSLFFNIEIRDCFNIFREIRKRKYDRTVFLDELREGLVRRMDNMDAVHKPYKR